MAVRNFPYRREVRPPVTDGLPEHTDREFEKIETAIAALYAEIETIKARLAAASIP